MQHLVDKARCSELCFGSGSITKKEAVNDALWSRTQNGTFNEQCKCGHDDVLRMTHSMGNISTKRRYSRMGMMDRQYKNTSKNDILNILRHNLTQCSGERDHGFSKAKKAGKDERQR